MVEVKTKASAPAYEQLLQMGVSWRQVEDCVTLLCGVRLENV
jgi:hypothetical protein